MVESTYIQFHVAIGWTGVAFGLVAMALRIPDFLCILKRIPIKFRILIHYAHSICGGLFLICSLFMPISSNWIWPRYGTPHAIIFLIASMYISIVLGLISIRIYKFKVDNCSITGGHTTTRLNTSTCVSSGVEILDSVSTDLPNQQENSWSWWILFKYAHAIFLIYSWVMLFGAGQAFLSNSRTRGFPYPPGELTDSLVGRCYGRNLQPPNLEEWLRNLTCGFSAMCKN
mmetsp:Transcript_15762/g.22498  ORF Transcript_15762/g.22498 Transcript_15762/m.22498 type:complete len:229 (+) Transcript_15762:77-763(+)